MYLVFWYCNCNLVQFFNFFRGDYCVEQVSPQIGTKKSICFGRVKRESLKCGQKHLNLDNEFIANFILLTNTKRVLWITFRALEYSLITSTIVMCFFLHKHSCWYSCFNFLHPVLTHFPQDLGVYNHSCPQSLPLLFLFFKSSGLEILPGSSFIIIWKANSNLKSKVYLSGHSLKWWWSL